MITDTRTETNKVIARRFIEEVFQRADEEAVDELVADDFRPHNWSTSDRGPDAVKKAIGRANKGLEDVRMTIEDVFGEDDRVAVRLTSTARQTGEFMSLPPSGKTYEIEEIHVFRIADGKIAEHWHQGDFMGLFRQLGATPPTS